MYKVQLAAARIVSQVLLDGRNLNHVLESAFNTKQTWSPAERGAIQDLSYGVIRHFGRLKTILKILLHKPLSNEGVEYLLLVALYQLQYSKSSEFTIVDQAVRAARTIQPQVGGLVNAILRNFIRKQGELLDNVMATVEARYSFPVWWVSELNDQYGAECASRMLEAGNLHPPMTLRVNKRRETLVGYQNRLAEHGMPARLVAPEALTLDKPANVDRLPGFKSGHVSVQDAGAQYAAKLLDVCDGMRVLDACAAPGGKTAHLLELADIEMLAVDKDEKRLQRVAENLQRLELSAQMLTGDASNPRAWWDGKQFDRILADVPCSASGVVKRHPDIKWLRRRVDIEGFAKQQLEIVEALWPLLRNGGKLLYATCSVFRQENDDVIDNFLQTHPDATRLSPSLSEGCAGQLLTNDEHDGFFYALLQKHA